MYNRTENRLKRDTNQTKNVSNKYNRSEKRLKKNQTKKVSSPRQALIQVEGHGIEKICRVCTNNDGELLVQCVSSNNQYNDMTCLGSTQSSCEFNSFEKINSRECVLFGKTSSLCNDCKHFPRKEGRMQISSPRTRCISDNVMNENKTDKSPKSDQVLIQILDHDKEKLCRFCYSTHGELRLQCFSNNMCNSDPKSCCNYSDMRLMKIQSIDESREIHNSRCRSDSNPTIGDSELILKHISYEKLKDIENVQEISTSSNVSGQSSQTDDYYGDVTCVLCTKSSCESNSYKKNQSKIIILRPTSSPCDNNFQQQMETHCATKEKIKRTCSKISPKTSDKVISTDEVTQTENSTRTIKLQTSEIIHAIREDKANQTLIYRRTVVTQTSEVFPSITITGTDKMTQTVIYKRTVKSQTAEIPDIDTEDKITQTVTEEIENIEKEERMTQTVIQGKESSTQTSEIFKKTDSLETADNKITEMVISDVDELDIDNGYLFQNISKQLVDIELNLIDSKKEEKDNKIDLLKNKKHDSRTEKETIAPHIEKANYIRDDGVDKRFLTPSERDILTSNLDIENQTSETELVTESRNDSGAISKDFDSKKEEKDNKIDLLKNKKHDSRTEKETIARHNIEKANYIRDDGVDKRYLTPSERDILTSNLDIENQTSETELVTESRNDSGAISKEIALEGDAKLDISEEKDYDFLREEEENETALKEFLIEIQNESHFEKETTVPHVEKPTYTREDGVDTRFLTPSERDILTENETSKAQSLVQLGTESRSSSGEIAFNDDSELKLTEKQMLDFLREEKENETFLKDFQIDIQNESHIEKETTMSQVEKPAFTTEDDTRFLTPSERDILTSKLENNSTEDTRFLTSSERDILISKSEVVSKEDARFLTLSEEDSLTSKSEVSTRDELNESVLTLLQNTISNNLNIS